MEKFGDVVVKKKNDDGGWVVSKMSLVYDVCAGVKACGFVCVCFRGLL